MNLGRHEHWSRLAPCPTPEAETLIPYHLLEAVTRHAYVGRWGTLLTQKKWRALRSDRQSGYTFVPDRTIVLLSQAGHAHHQVVFDYTDRHGNHRRYRVEPYSLRVRVRECLLFAYDTRDDSIKSFYVRHLQNLRVSRYKYEPRWRIEFPSQWGGHWERRDAAARKRAIGEQIWRSRMVRERA